MYNHNIVFLFLIITMKNNFFNKLKSIFTFKNHKHIPHGCICDIPMEEEQINYPIQSSKTGFDNHETITLDSIVSYLSSLPIWKKYNQKHSATALVINPKQIKISPKHTTKCNTDSVKLNEQLIKSNKKDIFISEDDNHTQFKQSNSVSLINDVLDLTKQKQKENTPNQISSNLINTVDTTSPISKNDDNQSTDITVSDETTLPVVKSNQYEHIFQEFTQKITNMAKNTIVTLTFNHPFFEISYEKNPHFHFQDIQEISYSRLHELQETKELVSFPLFFYPVFTTEVKVNETQETNENHVANEVNVVKEVKKIKFLLEEDLDKDDYLESCLGGQIGLIYVDKEIIRQKHKVKRITKKIHDELVDEIKKLLKQLNQQ